MDWVKDRRREELPSIWTLPYLLLSISFFLLLFLFVNIVFQFILLLFFFIASLTWLLLPLTDGLGIVIPFDFRRIQYR